MVKLEIQKLANGTIQASMSGKIDEHFDARPLLEAARGAPQVVLQLSGVRSISSLGVRSLEAFLRALEGRELLLDDISAALANQFTMIPNLLGSAKVRSAKLPFVCGGCGVELNHSVPYLSTAGQTHAPTCPTCQRKMEFDGFSEEYLPAPR
jgi:anti-anti-sigma regulatory factor